jgi:dipeptidyl aminopeptidase/acylaminoacyl peptidase
MKPPPFSLAAVVLSACLLSGPAVAQQARRTLTIDDMKRLAVVPAAGGPVHIVTAKLDRSVVHPAWSPDGTWIHMMLEDDRSMILARVRRAGGTVERTLDGRRSLSALTTGGGGGGHVAFIQSTVTHPDELYALDGDSARQISDHNPWLRDVQLAEQEPITTKSRDGTAIHGFLMKPVGYTAGARVPTILRLHGGPVSQWESGSSSMRGFACRTRFCTRTAS